MTHVGPNTRFIGSRPSASRYGTSVPVDDFRARVVDSQRAVSLDDEVQAELRELEAMHRLRVPRIVDGAQGPRITLDGVDVLNFASNDYLGLAGDRRIARAGANALDEDGAGAGASRLIVGNHRRHVQLERELADWLQVPAARFFNSGYAANVGVITALAREGDVIFSDELNHASIIDGCRLSRATVVVYPHRDIATLERELARRPGRRRLVVSETLFSMDGDIAELDVIDGLCRRHDAALVLDEAHAIGVWGPEGRGLAAKAGIRPEVLVGTCGKALGAFGAFVATSRAVADLLWNRARPFVFSTALPPSVPAMVHAAVQLIRSGEGDELRRSLSARATQLRDAIGSPASGAIVPLVVGDDARVMELSARLLQARIFVQGIRPPTVPRGTARLRIAVSAKHSETDVSLLVASLRDAMSHFT